MQLQLLIDWCLNAFALLATAGVVPGIHVDGFMAALIAAIVFGLANSLLNTFIQPVFEVLLLPENALTRGLFILVMNGLLLWLADFVLRGFSVDSFWHGVLGTVMYSFFNWGLQLNHSTNTREKTWE